MVWSSGLLLDVIIIYFSDIRLLADFSRFLFGFSCGGIGVDLYKYLA